MQCTPSPRLRRRETKVCFPATLTLSAARLQIKMSKAMVDAVRKEINIRVAMQSELDTLLAFNRLEYFEQFAARAVFTG